MDRISRFARARSLTALATLMALLLASQAGQRW
jgi:hypothetical protein